MTPALLKRKEVFNVRSFLFLLIVIFSVVLLAGCQKDNSVTPTTTKQTVKSIMTVDSTGLSGGDDDIKHPKP